MAMWTGAMEARLTLLWAQAELSTAAIGRAMGLGKNSVVGKAHRLGLPARESPIQARREGAPPRPAPRAGAVTLPVLPALARPVVVPRVEPPPVARPVFRVASKPCCWPIGEPGAQDFRFCEAAGVPGRPYCPAHCAVAYVEVRPRTPAELAADEIRRAQAMARGRQNAAAGRSWSG